MPDWAVGVDEGVDADEMDGEGRAGGVSGNSDEDERLVRSVAEHLSCVSLARALLKLAKAKVNIPNVYLISHAKRSRANSEQRTVQSY